MDEKIGKENGLRMSDFELQTQTSSFRSRISGGREGHFSVSIVLSGVLF
jgi:hypothetical protein